MLQYDGDLEVPTQGRQSRWRSTGRWGSSSAPRASPALRSPRRQFGHVTYFWNGNKWATSKRRWRPTSRSRPTTSSSTRRRGDEGSEITDETIDLLRSGEYRFGRLNFPSGDMVGHTGHLPATVEAMEIIDESMAKLVEVIDELDGVLIYTADHGNADIMFTESDGVRSPKTSATPCRPCRLRSTTSTTTAVPRDWRRPRAGPRPGQRRRHGVQPARLRSPRRLPPDHQLLTGRIGEVGPGFAAVPEVRNHKHQPL